MKRSVQIYEQQPTCKSLAAEQENNSVIKSGGVESKRESQLGQRGFFLQTNRRSRMMGQKRPPWGKVCSTQPGTVNVKASCPGDHGVIGRAHRESLSNDCLGVPGTVLQEAAGLQVTSSHCPYSISCLTEVGTMAWMALSSDANSRLSGHAFESSDTWQLCRGYLLAVDRERGAPKIYSSKTTALLYS